MPELGLASLTLPIATPSLNTSSEHVSHGQHRESGASPFANWWRNPWIWLAAIVCLLVISMNAARLTQPLSRDEGWFLTIAQEILDGRLPYRDAFDEKGPGIYYLLAALLTLTRRLDLFGQILVMRLVVLAANAGTAVGIIVLGQRWFRPGVGAFAALLWLFALPLYEGYFALTQPFAVVCVVWAVVLAGGIVRLPLAWSGLLAGALTSLGSIFLQSMVVGLAGVALVSLATALRQRPSRGFLATGAGQIAAVVFGALVPWLAVCVAFALSGGLDALIRDAVLANFTYPPFRPDALRAEIVLEFSWLPLLWVTPMLVIVGATARLVRTARPSLFMLGAGGSASALIGFLNLLPFLTHVRPHYWLAIVPWAALLTGEGIFFLLDRLRPEGEQRQLTNTSLHAVALAALVALLVVTGSGRPVLASQLATTTPTLQTQLAAGAWIAQRTRLSMRVLVAPAEPAYYYLSGRLPTTDFVALLPVNATPALISMVAGEIRGGGFDVIVWETWDTSPTWAPLLASIHQSYQLTDRNAATGLDFYTLETQATT